MACKRSDVTWTEVAYSLLGRMLWAASRRQAEPRKQIMNSVSQSFIWDAKRLECASRSSGHSTLVQIAVRRDSAPMGETGATTSASISELHGFSALAHYYPVGGVS